jgi:hypothetical protein
MRAASPFVRQDGWSGGETFRPYEVEAVEGSFVEGFVCGDFTEAGGVFEAGSGEAGGNVDSAALVEPAEEWVAVLGEEVREGVGADDVGDEAGEELGDGFGGLGDFGC